MNEKPQNDQFRLGPMLLGFSRDPEATYFYGQAASEVGVIAATNWDAA
jgi:hypothetical protein